jgi:thiol-disulfide isomerase/thioredoxin
MLDIRSEKDIDELSTLLKKSRHTLVLLYADWCPHCHTYLPVWDQLSTLPGRTANMAKVHFDMQEKIPAIAKAKIQGYPSVIKVLPDGTIEEFKDESGESTNALPNMRDNEVMKKNLVIEPVSKTNNFKKTVSNRAQVAKAANAANVANAVKAGSKAANAANAVKAGSKAANAANAANAHPGIVTSKEILKATKGLTQSGGSLWKGLQSISRYFKK